MDIAATKAKYAEEREKRLRSDGNDQYLRMAENFEEYLDDPYVEIQQRETKSDHVDVAFVGGGYAGLVTGARLAELGVTSYRVIEKIYSSLQHFIKLGNKAKISFYILLTKVKGNTIFHQPFHQMLNVLVTTHRL